MTDWRAVVRLARDYITLTHNCQHPACPTCEGKIPMLSTLDAALAKPNEGDDTRLLAALVGAPSVRPPIVSTQRLNALQRARVLVEAETERDALRNKLREVESDLEARCMRLEEERDVGWERAAQAEASMLKPFQDEPEIAQWKRRRALAEETLAQITAMCEGQSVGKIIEERDALRARVAQLEQANANNLAGWTNDRSHLDARCQRLEQRRALADRLAEAVVECIRFDSAWTDVSSALRAYQEASDA